MPFWSPSAADKQALEERAEVAESQLATAQLRIRELEHDTKRLTAAAASSAAAHDAAVTAAVKEALNEASEAAAEEVRMQLMKKEEQHVVEICRLKEEHEKAKKGLQLQFRQDISAAVKHYDNAHNEIMSRKENEIATLNEDLRFSASAKGIISNIFSPLVSARPSKRKRRDEEETTTAEEEW